MRKSKDLPGPARSISKTSVDVAWERNSDDEHEEHIALDLVDDAVVAYPDAQEARALQLCSSGRSG
ncbi:MAG TPA: hypothetical protein VK425_03320 [Acidimicrobiales bacterium]|nr:hypothetical protein [Acidimicrobiales bacterium]